MNIPVFVSSPTDLSPAQDSARSTIINFLGEMGLEPRALGRSDYPTELPLREVILIARRCSGGVILGLEQFRAESGISKPGTLKENLISTPTPFPTPWNQLEAGILFSLRLPILVFGKAAFAEEYLTRVSQTYSYTPCHLLPSHPTANMH